MTPEDLGFSSIRELGRLLRARKVSAVDLAQASLERLGTLGPKLGAVVTLTRELALDQARQADSELRAGRERGALHGIPFGVKDLLATKGIPTTWGAEPLREQVFDYDATAVVRLREAGAVLCAKLAMVELAGGMGYNNPDASFTGPGRTPWNPDYWSGGSSSGSGAAVAAGLVTFAIGSETSGSILTPASFCGVAGLRPTYGLVSRHGAMALCWTLDKLGPMARSADDAALVLAAIAGADPHDPTTTGDAFLYTARTTASARPRPRIGVVRHATASAIPEVRANFEQSLGVLRQFAEVEDDVPFPDFPWGPAVGTIVDAEGASAFRDFIESGASRRLRAQSDRTGGYAGLVTFAVDYLQAMRLRVPMRRALDELLSRYDALVLPTRSGVAPPIGYDFDKPPQPQPAPTPTPTPEPGAPEKPATPATIPAGNLAGLPALCVPNGFGPHGLPTSLLFLGRAFAEAKLVALANAYQDRTDWHTRRPPTSG
jgi:aspartyl-tRNA(Asn)/glutamyl-tRNA(Gln) amidotransferase subunit A